MLKYQKNITLITNALSQTTFPGQENMATKKATPKKPPKLTSFEQQILAAIEGKSDEEYTRTRAAIEKGSPGIIGSAVAEATEF